MRSATYPCGNPALRLLAASNRQSSERHAGPFAWDLPHRHRITRYSAVDFDTFRKISGWPPLGRHESRVAAVGAHDCFLSATMRSMSAWISARRDSLIGSVAGLAGNSFRSCGAVRISRSLSVVVFTEFPLFLFLDGLCFAVFLALFHPLTAGTRAEVRIFGHVSDAIIERIYVTLEGLPAAALT